MIVPFRDRADQNREEHLRIFLNHMHTFLQKQLRSYTIYIVEQVSGAGRVQGGPGEGPGGPGEGPGRWTIKEGLGEGPTVPAAAAPSYTFYIVEHVSGAGRVQGVRGRVQGRSRRMDQKGGSRGESRRKGPKGRVQEGGSKREGPGEGPKGREGPGGMVQKGGSRGGSKREGPREGPRGRIYKRGSRREGLEGMVQLGGSSFLQEGGSKRQGPRDGPRGRVTKGGFGRSSGRKVLGRRVCTRHWSRVGSRSRFKTCPGSASGSVWTSPPQGTHWLRAIWILTQCHTPGLFQMQSIGANPLLELSM